MRNQAINVIPNADFSQYRPGGLPDGWRLVCPQPYLAPHFALEEADGATALVMRGNGNENCMGWVAAPVPVVGGRTYRLRVRFRASDDVDPYQHLLFSFWGGPYMESWAKFNEGIFSFRRSADGRLEGERTFWMPGEGAVQGELRICYRLHAGGHAALTEVTLEETDPIPERNVRVTCVRGHADDLELWGRVLDEAAAQGADLALLPETFAEYRPAMPEPIDGRSADLMSRKAREHGMYVAGTFIHRDKADGHLYNTGLLFDRDGQRIGRYDKFHLYSPELMQDGITPGSDIPVFRTDFGTVGMMICYDSWFTDVAELLSLKGAEIILFPNAGYYRTLMPARANDNGVRIVCSSMYHPLGIWDTSGGDVEAPELDPTRCSHNDRTFRDVVRGQVGSIELLTATLDLNQSPSAANWGGPMMSAPGGRRNRREQKRLLYEEIRDLQRFVETGQ